MGRHKGRAFWERAVADAQACASQAEAARRHGVSTSGLAYWVRRLGEAQPLPAPEPQLLPVRLTGHVMPHRLELVVADLRVEFDEGADPMYLAALAKALRSC
jgi:transposase-like protein